MKIYKFLFIIAISLLLTGCSRSANNDDNANITPTSAPVPTVNTVGITLTPVPTEVNTSVEANTHNATYCFDATKEWDADEYKNKHGLALYEFNAPVYTPYMYSYKSKTDNPDMNVIATELGKRMFDDFLNEYEGKSFTVTEYKNLVSHILTSDELEVWIERYRNESNINIIFNENQWLCEYSCDYKYEGVYSGIGEMPIDSEWFHLLKTDGSGENQIFIIQKVDKNEYVMRGLPKTVHVLKDED